MQRIRSLIFMSALLLVMSSAEIARADCIRSCTAQLWVKLTYQPEGQSTVQKKTDLLKTTKTATRDGRAGRTCMPHNILEAKKRACTDAVKELMRRYSSPNSQTKAVCEAVENSKNLIHRPDAQDEIYPAADWYQIDQMLARGSRDIVKMKGDIKNVERSRFRCEGDRAVNYSPTPPPPSGGYPAPPPSSAGSREAGPPPPPTVVGGDRRPDLMVSKIGLLPSEPVQGKRVRVRVTVHNRGESAADAFTVRWWPGENYPEPACTWNVSRLEAGARKTLRCHYSGYPSWYARITTKAVADTENTVDEKVENNNYHRMEITVAKTPPPSSGGSPAQPPPPTSTGSGEAGPPPPPTAVVVGDRRPDLMVSNIRLGPSEPVQGKRVRVRVTVHNRGESAADAFTVQWWPGENYPEPACTWNVSRLEAGARKTLRCRYSGYPSWYARITTKAVADTENTVDEKVENNNYRRMEIRVAKP